MLQIARRTRKLAKMHIVPRKPCQRCASALLACFSLACLRLSAAPPLAPKPAPGEAAPEGSVLPFQSASGPDNAATPDSKNPAAAYAEVLGSAALSRGDVREARTQFQSAVDTDPGEPAYHFDLANVLYMFRHDLANPQGAAGSEAMLVSSLEQFRLAAALAPLDASLAQAYAETFDALAQPVWNDALSAWKRVLALQQAHPDFANAHLARVSLHLGDPDQADRFLEAIHDPGFNAMKATLHAQAEKLRRQKLRQ